MKKSNQFFGLGVSFVLGVALGEIFSLPSIAFLAIFFIVLNVLVWAKSARALWLFFLLFVFGWWWRGFIVPVPAEMSLTALADEKTTLTGVVTAEPDRRLDRQYLVIAPESQAGKVRVLAPLYPEYFYGDVLAVTGRWRRPEPIEDFRYDKYLEKSGIYLTATKPKIEVREQNQGNPAVAMIYRLKSVFAGAINRTMPEPAAALTAGILLGSRQGLPPALLEAFNRDGITHIIAVSGFNITIIITVLFNLSKYLGVNRRRAFWLIAGLLVVFCVLTGMSASVIRASLMGFLVVLAAQCGRMSSPRNVLTAAAAVMIFFNPLILLWDAGFQLSFLSTVGLMYGSPLWEKRLAFLPETLGLRENLQSTLSATVFTLPLILFQFGRLSLVAPLVNILVLPVIPVAMLTGFLQGVSGLVWLPLGQLWGWFTWLLLMYVVRISEIFATWSLAAVDFSVPWWAMVICYIMIGGYLFQLSRKSALSGSSNKTQKSSI